MVIEQNKLADEVRRIVEAIGKVMAVDDDLEDADAERLHDIFVACITAVNARLRHCDDLMRKGLRQEALQECERNPNVLDLVARLDLPEWDAWADYIKQFGLAPQPSLLLNIASDLNAAYVQAQSLDDVMRLYRMHALARSPLVQRLAVLRTIADRDADNHVWQSDLRTFEAARLREISAEFTKHAASDDFRGISHLQRELGEPGWLTTLPAQLTARVAEAHDRLLVKRARQRLVELAGIIDSAFSQFDQNAAWQARDEWDEQAAVARLQADDELSVRVAPAFQWLDELRDEHDRRAAFESSVAALELALDDPRAGATELVRLYAVVERYDEALSPRLMRRYEERMRALDLAARRRTRLIVAVSAAAVILLGAATLWGVDRQLKGREIGRVQATLASYLEEGDFEQAEQFYNTAAKDVDYIAEAPEIKKLAVELQSGRERDQQRVTRLAAALDRAEKLVEAPTWTSIRQANKELDAAKTESRTEADKTMIAEVERRVKQQQGAFQDAEDEAFQRDFAAIAKQLLNLNELEQAQVESLVAATKDLQSRYRGRASGDAVKQSGIDLAIRKLEDRLQSLRVRREESVAAARLREGIGSPPSFALALKVFRRLQTPRPEDPEIEQSINDIQARLTEIAAWNGVAARWNAAQLADSSPEPEAGKVLAVIEKQYAAFPLAAEALARKPYLESLAARNVDADDAPMREIQQILNNRWFDMLSVETADGAQQFYLMEPANTRNKGFIAGRKLTDRHGSETSPFQFKVDQVKARPDGSLFGPSPQKQFSERGLKWLNDNAAKSYEEQLGGLLSLLLEEPGMDPILRCYLLQTMEEIASRGSSILQNAYKPFREAIRTDVTLSDQNWVSYDAETNAVRLKTSDILKRAAARTDILPRTVLAKVILPELTRTLASPRLPEIRWVGFVVPSDGGKLTLLTRLELLTTARGPLLTYDPAASPTAPFSKIGAVENGRPLMAPDAALHDGQLVFALVDAGSK